MFCRVEAGRMISVLALEQLIFLVRWVYAIHRRGEKLTWSLLIGLAIGGTWGFKEGMSRPLGNNPSFKLRLNSILNGCTRRGSFMGNSLGVLGELILHFPLLRLPLMSNKAIFYNISNSSFDAIRGKHDALNAMAAAGLSGAIYKSTGTSLPIPVYSFLNAQLIFL